MLVKRLLQRLHTSTRASAQQVDLPPSFRPTSPSSSSSRSHPNMSSNNANQDEEQSLPIYPRLNVFGSPLLPAPTGQGPTTGFFRNNFCDASPHDPGSHTVAAVVTPAFLAFSKSRGNDLTSLFPSLKQPSSPSLSTSSQTTSPPCVWCLCASRWLEALRFSSAGSHSPSGGTGNSQYGEEIVPRVVLEATHERALTEHGGPIPREDLERFAVGGDGSGTLPGGGGGSGGASAGSNGYGQAGRATGESVGR
ncbi:hypothetical protein JCM8097_005423 [Rhodosporidiobolus ruineniae]